MSVQKNKYVSVTDPFGQLVEPVGDRDQVQDDDGADKQTDDVERNEVDDRADAVEHQRNGKRPESQPEQTDEEDGFEPDSDRHRGSESLIEGITHLL